MRLSDQCPDHESAFLPTTQVHFEPPAHYSRRFPCQIIAEGACCTCMGNLIFALERLQEQRLLSKQQTFLVGQQAQVPQDGKGMTIAVGQCAVRNNQADVCIDVCPPSAGIIYRRVASVVNGMD